MRIGAIDIGSNSIRLLVADFHPGADNDLVTIARAGEACRLGRGLDHRPRGLRDRGTRAVLAAEFLRGARSLAERLVVGATAALRKAEEGAEVAAMIGERCGERVRVLSGEDERGSSIGP
jgi:exopolyphosphatase/guanosine-5'-triphosphate,3'-diphosphate pyrophosphatase